MDLKLGLNRVVQPGERKALSATAAADMEDAVLRGILEQTASLAGEGADSWTELALKEGLSPAIRAQLLEAGMEEKTLENEDAFAVLGEGSALTIWANTRNGWLYARVSCCMTRRRAAVKFPADCALPRRSARSAD